MSHTYWISITPRKAAKTYQTAKWCLRSSGSLGGFVAFGRAVSSPFSPKRRNRGKRQPRAGCMSLVGVSSMSASHAELGHYRGRGPGPLPRRLRHSQVEFTLLPIEFPRAAEFSFCAKRGRKIQAGGRKIQVLGNENPSVRE